jgi:glyoxylase-like metal-dependent hydrolase (beta-lactamase superfamily II)
MPGHALKALPDWRSSMSALVDVLVAGYVGDRVASTVTLIRDGDTIAVVDPGMVSHRDAILGPLAAAGLASESVTDVILSHHHPDHTINIALFPHARIHDHMATYVADNWIDRTQDDSWLTEHIRLLRTPGHSAEDISTIVTSTQGLVVLTHLWWHSGGPAVDPYAPDQQLLSHQRRRILDLAPDLVIPGHGAAFAPHADLPC